MGGQRPAWGLVFSENINVDINNLGSRGQATYNTASELAGFSSLMSVNVYSCILKVARIRELFICIVFFFL